MYDVSLTNLETVEDFNIKCDKLTKSEAITLWHFTNIQEETIAFVLFLCFLEDAIQNKKRLHYFK